MAKDTFDENEAVNFKARIEQPHRRVDPCFMTGKACVYSDLVERELKTRRDGRNFLSFMIVPFRRNIQVFFRNCLIPFLKAHYCSHDEIKVNTADEVRRPGVIICEGICKRIQESDFVIADISTPNANVFYELGLAYGLNHKILLVYHSESKFGPRIMHEFRDLNCKAYAYQNLDPIKPADFILTQFLWDNRLPVSHRPEDAPRILFYERHLEAELLPPAPTPPAVQIDEPAQTIGDITLTFEAHTKSAVGLAVAEMQRELRETPEAHKVIDSYLPIIEGLRDTVSLAHDRPTHATQQQVNSSYCLMARTGGRDCHPMSYFWLGYCHALGKNVIPITVVKRSTDPIEDLAFDIRAQRHMTFASDRPELLEREISETLRLMITSDFGAWSRNHFWNEIIRSGGEISIFTGALHNEEYHREMIGDWDLRTVSELTSYFGQHHHRFKIETPIYPPDRARRGPDFHMSPEFVRDYVQQLVRMMYGKNCVIVASPDVNPLTEIALGTIYSVPPEEWFSSPVDQRKYPNACVAFKERERTQPEDCTPGKRGRAFYAELPVEISKRTRRGFECAVISGGRVSTEFRSQEETEGDFLVYAHLVILPNPFQLPGIGQRYIVVLSGISGPATFALTQVLTGGVSREFVAYEDGFHPEAASEHVLSGIMAEMEKTRSPAIECFIKVKVGPAPGKPLPSSTYDWRRIMNWELDASAFGQDPIRKTSFTCPSALRDVTAT